VLEFGVVGGGRRRVHDRARFVAVDHVLGRRLRAEEDSARVDAVDGFEVLGTHLAERSAHVYAGVVDHRIDAAELAGTVDDRIELGRVADVGLDELGLAAPLADRLVCRSLGVRVLRARSDVGVDDGRIRSPEGQRDRAADPRTGAGDDDRFAVETSGDGTHDPMDSCRRFNHPDKGSTSRRVAAVVRAPKGHWAHWERDRWNWGPLRW
jgi:hypothetical protein